MFNDIVYFSKSIKYYFKGPEMLYGRTKYLLVRAIFIILSLSVKEHLAWKSSERVLLKEVTALTLYSDKMTTGRRSAPVPQLQCVGGSAKGYYKPKVVQCYNRGFDGYDVQWECKAEMPSKYKLGKIQVSCEGYDYPSDPYILAGSCGLEYNLEFSSPHQEKSKEASFKFADLIIIAIALLLGYAVYVSCTRQQSQYQYSTTSDDDFRPDFDRRGYGDDGSWTFGSPPPPGFHAPPPTDSCSRPRYTSGSGNYGGFWTGAAAGGMLGYLFGSRGRESSYGSYYSQPRSSFSSSDRDSFSTSTSFGGTSRR